MADETNMFAEWAPTADSVAGKNSNMFAEWAGSEPKIGIPETLLRSSIEGATFGVDDKLGMDKERREASRRQNPWAHLAGEVMGGIVPMAGAALLPTGATQVAAAGRAAQLLGKGAGLVRGAMVPAEAATLGQAALQGAKVGATYGGLSGAGHADVKPDASWGDAAAERLIGGAKSAAVGAALGPVVGAAGYGLGKAIGAGANRVMPELRDVMAATTNPELQGVRDFMRQAGYDKYTIADLAALRDKLRDPTQAHRYADLNLIEALETAPLKARLGTGELAPPVVTSPNLRDLAQDFANTGGAGRQQAVEAFASRKNEMPAKMQGDVDRFFGTAQRTAGEMSDAPVADRIPGVIDTYFGSGAREAETAAMQAQKSAFGKRYDRLRSLPLQKVDDIGAVAQSIPEFKSALQYAAKNDMIRMTENGLADANWKNPWSSLLSHEHFDGKIPTLSPDNILDIHHALVTNAKPPITGATPESMMAGKLKTWFSNWVDGQFRGHKALREDYSIFKRTMEAQELGGKLPINSGGADHPSLKFLSQVSKEYQDSANALRKHVAAYDTAMAKYEAGARKTPPPVTALNAGIARMEARQGILEAYQKSAGEAWKTELAQSNNAQAFVKKALTPEGQRRIALTLGPEKGQQFIGQLLVMDARNQGLSLGLNAGSSDHAALQFFDRAMRASQTDVVNEFRLAWGDRIKQEVASATAGPNATINKLLTQEGKDRILRVLGPEAGKEFIETLYNKKMQTGLSQTLFGGPDTAYKLARGRKLDSLMDAVHGLAHLRPMQVTKALGEIGSSAYKQRRADQGNAILSRQGPEKVGEILDAILARDRLRLTSQPYTGGAALKVAGPTAASIPPVQAQATEDPQSRLVPFRP